LVGCLEAIEFLGKYDSEKLCTTKKRNERALEKAKIEKKEIITQLRIDAEEIN
jgi:hypothetical protein